MWKSVLRPSTCGNVIRTPKVLKRLERLLPKPVIGAANQHLRRTMHEASSFMATNHCHHCVRKWSHTFQVEIEDYLDLTNVYNT